jgi:ketosteroid isomerase-like protein
MSEMKRPKPSADAIAAAMEAAQRLAAEADAEDAAHNSEAEFTSDFAMVSCSVCEYRNREGNKFCGMCGMALPEKLDDVAPVPARPLRSASAHTPVAAPSLPQSHVAQSAVPPLHQAIMAPEETTNPRTGNETHHYHHHYHHHYFPGAQDGAFPGAVEAHREAARDFAREDRMRPTAALRGDMSRAEAAVRRITHEWMLACNTKHLDDLLDLYVSDPLVLRSNCPPIRGAAAVREFFFGALDAGLGEVEFEPMRVEVVGDLAYEAGRCKALIPGATGKRKEERGKYLWVCQRQSNGEWKLAADCWSSDLTLTMLESDVPQGATVKTSQPRKGS